MENLNQLIERLTSLFVPTAENNQSYFVNDVPRDLCIDLQPQFISPVIYRMLSAIVNHVKKSSIRMTAKKHGLSTILEIRESGSVNSYAMASELQEVNLLARRMGGDLNITLPGENVTSIVFSFPIMGGHGVESDIGL